MGFSSDIVCSPLLLHAVMSSSDDDPSSSAAAAPSPAVPAAMAVTASVDVKAELASLLDEWEEARRGTAEQLVTILTKSDLHLASCTLLDVEIFSSVFFLQDLGGY